MPKRSSRSHKQVEDFAEQEDEGADVFKDAQEELSSEAAAIAQEQQQEDARKLSSEEEDAGGALTAPRHHKAARLEDAGGDYKRGTVKKVTVKDFMTYAGKVIITPGPRLNLVLGPNGTGKSSLVCALCVGMGGSTKLLGRADNLGDYVRRGCDAAYVEVELSGGVDVRGKPKRDIIIRRDIQVHQVRDADGQLKRTFKSEYRLNGAPAQQDMVKEQVKELNIQFDNLCQFLPQDKVVEFAKMQPKELLEATEKALGDSLLYNLHVQLREERLELRQKEAEHDRLDTRLKGLQQQQEAQRGDFERVARREKLLADAKLRRGRVLWVKAQHAERAKAQACEEEKQVAKELKDKKREQYQQAAPARWVDESLAAAKKVLPKAQSKAQAALRSVQQAAKELEDIKADLDEQEDKQKSLKTDSERHRGALAKLQQDLVDLAKHLEALPKGLPPELEQTQAEFQAGHEQKRQERHDFDQRLYELAPHLQALEAERRQINLRMQELSNDRDQQLRTWEMEQPRRAQGIRHVHGFVNENRGRFRGPVYGPIALEMHMRAGDGGAAQSALWRSYLEKQCGAFMFNFVTSCREDEALLTDFIKANNLTLVTNAVTHNFNEPILHPRGDASQYQQYGITHTLDQLFDAPELVKHMLCDLAKINQVYVGMEQTREMMEELFATQVNDVYIGEMRMSFSVSHYNRRARTTAVEGIGVARVLSERSLRVVEEERNRLRQLLNTKEQERRVLEERQQEYVVARTECEGEMARFQDGLRKIQERQQRLRAERQRCELDIAAKKAQLCKRSKEPDPLSQLPTVARVVRGLLGALAQQCSQQVGKLQAYWQACCEFMYTELACRELEALTDAANARAQRHEQEVRTLTHALDVARRTLDKAKEKHDKAVQLAEVDAGERTAEMDALGDDAEALTEEADRMQAQADGIAFNDASVIQVYNERKAKIQQLEREVEALHQEMERMRAQLQAKKRRWKPALGELVETINGRFSTNFAEIGCAGEVKLKWPDHPDGEDDFEEYEIIIMVKFRNSEPLQPLTANRQSGGERSVSTILYLIALQGVTETPFRVVDEINQGMDPVNERKVFIQLVESSCKPDTPQCFLLTPKLLPGLPFDRAITVLSIMNGPSIDREVIDAYGAHSNHGGGSGAGAWLPGDLLGSFLGARRTAVAAR